MGPRGLLGRGAIQLENSNSRVSRRARSLQRMLCAVGIINALPVCW